MAFEIPTLGQIRDRMFSDAEGEMRGSQPRLRRTLLRALITALAGAVKGLYEYISWVMGQLFWDKAEAVYLDRWASLFSVARKAATFTHGLVNFSGTNGVEIPLGTKLQRADGVEYTVDQAVTVAGGSAAVSVTATKAGQSGDCGEGTRISLISPVAGINPDGQVAEGGLSGGADVEKDDALRGRFADRLAEPPGGGNDADYKAWALKVPEITRVWVFRHGLGVGTVLIYVAADGNELPAPSSAKVVEVASYIEALRPNGAEVFVTAPVLSYLDMELSITPDNSANRNAVRAALEDLLTRTAAPGATTRLTALTTAIASAGVDDYQLTSPSADVPGEPGKLYILGALTWL